MLKICRECAFYRVFRLDPALSSCAHPSLDPVNGGKSPRAFCAMQRERGSCGPAGTLWQPRPPSLWQRILAALSK